MEFINSCWLLLKLSFKRWWPFAVFWLLTAAGLYERYIKSRVSTSIQGDIEFGLEITPIIVVGGAGMAIALTYHELRMERDVLKKQLDDKARKREIREALRGFLGGRRRVIQPASGL